MANCSATQSQPTVALAVLGMRAPILAPIIAMALNPRALRPRLVLAVVGIALSLGPLPTSPARLLTGRCTAVHLIRDLRTRSERLTAGRTPPPLLDHRTFNFGSSEIGFNKEIYQLALKISRLYDEGLCACKRVQFREVQILLG
jgi:hypothetical protein